MDKMFALTGQIPVAQVAVINMPSEADRAERRELDNRLDAIARRLADAQAPSE